MKFLSAKGLVLGGALLAFSLPSHAVVLKQKWQEGQKLNYALDLDGTANLQLPPGAPGMDLFAGVPLEVQMRGTGMAAFSTLKVDEFGTGTVAVSVPSMKLNAQTMGQKAQWTLTNGKSQFALNGQPLNIGALPQGDGKPTAALKISADGQFKGIEQLGTAGKPAPQPAAPANPANAIDQTGLLWATVLNSFPALWPNNDVKTGDTWKANVDFAPLARPAKDGEEVKPLGTFDLKLEGEDVVMGKTLHRVALKGDLDLDGKTLEKAFPAIAAAGKAPAAPAAGAPKANAPRGNMANTMTQARLDHANQTVEGTVWFDAAAGQIVKTELVLGGRAQALTGNGNKTAESWFDFTGTLNMALQSK
ncbi:hypothetical protein EON83_18725 [bacterium]|nr:MAG: hypothetical protein EON83_18725 [bacterium]